MSLSSRLEQASAFLGRHRTSAIVVVTAAVFAVIAYVGNLWQILAPLEGWLSSTFQPFLGWLFLVAVLGVVILGGAYGLAGHRVRILEAQLAVKPLEPANKGVQIRKTLEGIMRAAFRITQQMQTGRPKKMIQSLNNTYIIHSNYDGEVLRTYEIQAIEVLHFWEIKILVEPEAPGQEFLDGINFRVTDGEGNTLAYLPIENGPREKIMAVFFLPPLQPNEKQKVIVSYKWPGMFTKLKVVGSERVEWDMSPQTTSNIPRMSFSFFVDPKLGLQLQIMEEGSRAGRQSKIPAREDRCNWLGTSYVVEDGPPGKYAINLTLR